MKKFLVGMVLVLALTLTACGSTQQPNSFANAANAALTPEARLGLGILKLEGTPQAVSADQAAQLLPLWQLLKELNSSSSSAPEEVSAVLDQIQAAMTADQTSFIDGLQLTQRDVFQTLQDMGAVGGGFAGASANGTPSARANGNTTRQNGQGGGNFQGGGGFVPGGGGGFGPGAGANGNTNSNSSTQTQQNRQNFQNASSILLVNEVIKILEGKIQK